MQRFTLRELVGLGLAAAAVTGLGAAMHLEHRAAHRACVEAHAVEHLPVEQAHVYPATPEPASEPAAKPVGSPLAYGRPFSFVVTLDGRPHLVLSTDVDPAWHDGQLHLAKDDRVHADVDLEALPDALAMRQDGSVVLYGASGVLGFGELGAPTLVAELEGELALLLPDPQLDAWYEALERGDDPPPLPPDLVWENGRRLLVAPIATPVREPVVWARDAELPAPAVLVAAPKRGDDPDRGARARLLEHPEARALMKRLQRDEQPSPQPEDRIELRTWRDEAGAVRVQTAWFEGPELGACGGDGAPVWAGVELTSEAAVRPWPWRAGDHVTGPVVIADLDADGHWDIVMGADPWASESVLLAGGPEGWTAIAALPERPYIGCPC